MNLTELLLKEGTSVSAGGNRPFPLSQGSSIWFVESGTVDVFAVPITNSDTEGARTHLLRASAGQCLLPLETVDQPNLRFLAVGSTESGLRALPLSRIKALTVEPDFRAQFADSVDVWIASLYSGLCRALPPKEFTLLSSQQEHVLPKSTTARPSEGVLWVRPNGKTIRLGGIEELTLSPNELTPITPLGWLESVEETSIYATPTADLVAQGSLWSALAHCGKVVTLWASFNQAQAVAEERQRLQVRSGAELRSLRAAATDLLSVIGDKEMRDSLAVDERDAVWGACQLLAAEVGAVFKAPSASAKEVAERDTLHAITSASRVRVRRVVLKDEWWKADNGPLLAFLEESERPVALIQTSPCSYVMADPVERTRVAVTEATSCRVKPVAYMFYRPFPDRVLKVWDVIKFGLRGTYHDIVFIALIGLAGGALNMLTPIATGLIFDSIIPSGQRSQLVQIVLGLFMVAGAEVLFEITRGVALVRAQTKSNASIQTAVWDRLLSLPTKFFRKYSAGDLAMRANGVNEIREQLSSVVMGSVLSGVFSIFNFGLLFYYSSKLALIASLLVLLSILVTVAASLVSIRFERLKLEIQGKISGLVLEFVTGISKLRVAGAEHQAYAVWARSFAKEKRCHVQAETIANYFQVFNSVFPTVASVTLFGAMGIWLSREMSAGAFLAFNAAWGGFLSAMLGMTSALLSTLEIIPLYERAKPILESVPEVDNTKIDPGVLSGRIEVSHLRFRYREDGPLILNDISLQIAPGEFVALVGPSGSGKSTMFRLLLGFESPESGTLYFDGKDLATLDIQAVRKQFGVVLQQGDLMPGSIFENIVGNSALTLEDAWEAARKAGLAEDIESMPMGMHTVLGEGATTLSGGQRQRLMIARAIVHRPRIILFDEATSALDNRTQATVSRSLEQLQATRIVIAHRLSTIMNADRIFVLQNGRLVQSGNYESLVNQPGVFADLAKRQLA